MFDWHIPTPCNYSPGDDVRFCFLVHHLLLFLGRLNLVNTCRRKKACRRVRSRRVSNYTESEYASQTLDVSRAPTGLRSKVLFCASARSSCLSVARCRVLHCVVDGRRNCSSCPRKSRLAFSNTRFRCTPRRRKCFRAVRCLAPTFRGSV